MSVAILLVVLFVTCDPADRTNLVVLLLGPVGWMIFLWVVIPQEYQGGCHEAVTLFYVYHCRYIFDLAIQLIGESMKSMTDKELRTFLRQNNERVLAALVAIREGMETEKGKKAIQKQIREFEKSRE